MKNNYPLLSTSLKETLERVIEKYDDPIAKEIIDANTLIESRNWLADMPLAFNHEIIIEVLNEKIDSLITEVARAITLKPLTFEVTYTPEDKELVYNSDRTWKQINRQSGKPTKLFRKLLKKEFKEYPYEQFNNRLRAESQITGDFKIVSGSDITKYYNENTYYECTGTLGNSCMRYRECGESGYFKVYEDCAKMLVLFSKEDSTKIIGRAILWEIDGITYMDRVYVYKDHLVNSFIDYAKQNKWCYREHQNLMDNEIYWMCPDDNYQEASERDLCIELPRRYPKMPYVDTLAYYDNDRLYNKDPYDEYYRLSNTDGDYIDAYNEVCCYHCHTVCDDTFPAHYCDVVNQWLCEHCCRYIPGEGIWIPNDYPTVKVIVKDTIKEFTETFTNYALVPSTEEITYKPWGIYFIEINDNIYQYKPEWFTWNEERSCYEPNQN